MGHSHHNTRPLKSHAVAQGLPPPTQHFTWEPCHRLWATHYPWPRPSPMIKMLLESPGICYEPHFYSWPRPSPMTKMLLESPVIGYEPHPIPASTISHDKDVIWEPWHRLWATLLSLTPTISHDKDVTWELSHRSYHNSWDHPTITAECSFSSINLVLEVTMLEVSLVEVCHWGQ